MHQQRTARRRGRPVENKWIEQRFADPDLDLAALARAQGAVAYGPVRRAGDLIKTLQDAVAQTVAGNVVVVEVLVDAEYDTTIANSTASWWRIGPAPTA
jgi:predicted dehydrogenase